MPNRLIRDDILESEAVLGLPVEARWLYVTILLSADDVGLFEATAFRLARRADVRREHADKLVGLLVDADLIRLYQVDGKAYGFIPKYRQRLQIRRCKHPVPPAALYADDEDAISKINNLGKKATVDNGESPKVTVGQPSEPEPEPEPEVVVKGKVVGVASPLNASRKRSAPRRGSRLDPDWVLPKPWGDWALEYFPGWGESVVRQEAEKFSAHYHAAAGKNCTKLDWFAAWRSWCLSDIAQRCHPGGNGARSDAFAGAI